MWGKYVFKSRIFWLVDYKKPFRSSVARGKSDWWLIIIDQQWQHYYILPVKTDQTAWMYSLVWVFTGHAYSNVHFLTLPDYAKLFQSLSYRQTLVRQMIKMYLKFLSERTNFVLHEWRSDRFPITCMAVQIVFDKNSEWHFTSNLNVPITTVVDHILKCSLFVCFFFVFFVFFLQRKWVLVFHVNCLPIHMKFRDYFFWKNEKKKKKIRMPSAVVLCGILRVTDKMSTSNFVSNEIHPNIAVHINRYFVGFEQNILPQLVFSYFTL